MALQHLDRSATGSVLPEALARFAHVDDKGIANPLRAISWVAMAVDAVVIFISLTIGFIARGTGPYPWRATIAILVVWIAALAIRGAYDDGRIGVGSDEFKNVLTATIGTFAFLASVGFVLEITDGRRFIIGTFAAGVLLLPLGRRFIRVWIFNRRRHGLLMRRTLIIGAGPGLRELEDKLTSDSRAGFRVVSAMQGPVRDADIDHWLDQVNVTLQAQEVDAVAVSQTSSMTSEVVRRLSWRLEGPNIDLLVAPTLGDVTGPRLNIRPAAGLPLLHLEEPRLTGPQALLKRGTDVLVASIGLLLISPVLLLIGLTIRVTSSGPAFFIQDRVGQAGRVYQLIKFRTMYEGSDQIRLDTLGSLAGDPEAYRTDPRVTPFGRFLRRWSLDELPQLWNVLAGAMSLVGPRPMLTEELALLATSDHRRHLVKPGMTGLWQVAGRKEVPWSERMQMDLRYVENWSPTMDLVIMTKTVKAVATGKGAH